MWYLCGLGSNIRPWENLPRALDRLVRKTGRLRVSPIIATPPYGIDSDRGFLNALVVLQSPLPEAALKDWFNGIEEALGRDRSDPASSHKDRTIDIDILEASAAGPLTGAGITEPYFRQLLSGDRALASDYRSVRFADTRLGEATATVHWDHRTGHEVVVDECQRLLDDTLEASLPGQ